jgi:hypothetical protein
VHSFTHDLDRNSVLLQLHQLEVGMETKATGQLLRSDASERLIAFRIAVARVFSGCMLPLDREMRRWLTDAEGDHDVGGYPIIPIALTMTEVAENSPTGMELGARIADEGISVQ